MTIDFYYMPYSAPCRAVLLTARALNINLNLKFVDLRIGEHLKPEFLKGKEIEHLISLGHERITEPSKLCVVLLLREDMTLNIRRMACSSSKHFEDEQAIRKTWILNRKMVFQLNPLHTVPVLDDDGLVLTESRAIITYLANKYGKNSGLYPEDTRARAIVDQRLYFDMGTLYQRFYDYFYLPLYSGAPLDEAKLAKVEAALKVLDTFLEGQKYVAGPTLTIADLSLIAGVVTFDEIADIDLSKYPNVKRWMETMKSSAPGHKEINEEGIVGYKALMDSLRKKATAKVQ